MTQTIIDQPRAPGSPEPVPAKPRHNLAWYGWIAGLVVLAGAALALTIWWWQPYPFHGIVLQSPEPATDFTLTASTGSPLRLSALRGKVVLLYFGYTACPDACPLTLADLVQTRQLLGKQADKVQVLFISVDPAHDNPLRLAKYLAAFDKSFLGMTGTPAAISTVATQFGTYYDPPQQQADETKTTSPITHTSSVIVIDPAGYVRLIFPNGTSPADMAADLANFTRG